jgi:hypothetical protein
MSYYGSTDPASGPNAGVGFKARVLQLTFDAKGILVNWSKNY